MQLVVYRRAECILKAASGVGGEIHGHSRAVGDRPRYLDVEHDLGIRAGRCRGTVVRLVNQNRANRRGPQIEVLKILLQVGRSIAAAQLDDADGLPVAVRIRREVIQRCHLGRRIGRG